LIVISRSSFGNVSITTSLLNILGTLVVSSADATPLRLNARVTVDEIVVH
jgi:hypothetical protein